jgi:HflK protein
MEWVADILRESWQVWNESALYVLIGFALAGVIHVVGIGGWLMRVIRRRDARAVGMAAVAGVPLPLCSCGVLPAGAALRRQGASKGAVVSFLISTPETSVPSMFITYGLLGPLMTIVRPVAAFVTAVTAGLLVNVFDREEVTPDAGERTTGADEKTGGACCHEDSGAAPEEGACCEETPKDSGCCHTASNEAPSSGESCCATEASAERAAARESWWKRAYSFAFVELFDDIVGWLVLGIVLAGVIQAVAPGFVFEALFGGRWRAMLIMLVIGIPLYVCATASTPVAAALILRGVSPGAALVFLLAGPATNIGSIGVLWRELGKRSVVIYLGAVAAVSVLMGVYLDWAVARWGVDLQASVQALARMHAGSVVRLAGSLVLLALVVLSVRRTRPLERVVRWVNGRTGLRLPAATGRWAVIALALGAWLLSGFVAIQPGQAGLIKRFGAQVGPVREPGLAYHWPAPFGSVDRVAVDRVRRATIGFVVEPSAQVGSKATRLPDESAMLSGDENIVDTMGVVQYCVKPGAVRAFAYDVADAEMLVMDLAQAAVRQVLAGEDIDDVLTTDRGAVEAAARAALQGALDHCEAGVRVTALHLVSVHAPPDVHPAFRDVASAVEDKATAQNLARVDWARLIPQARGQAAAMVREAEGTATMDVDRATGEASRFVCVQEAYAAGPRVTALRLYHEMVERVLPGARKFVRPAGDAAAELDLWFLGGSVRTVPQIGAVAPTTAAPKPRERDVLRAEDLDELLGP